MRHCKYLALCFSWLFISLNTYGQDWLPVFVDFTNVDSDTLTWKDKQGEHFLLLETSDVVEGKEPDTHSQSVRVVHWLKIDEQMKEIWSFEDGEYDCPVDVGSIFKTAPRFSDLNDDGIYEVWFMIEKFCKGDISPSELQVIMFNEKAKKYILEGTMKQIFPDQSSDGGTYNLKDFNSLPREYQDYAEAYFQQNYVQKF